MQSKQGIQVPNDIVITEGTTTIVITEPTRKSRKFEDNVRVIRIFKPDQEKMVAALKEILSFPPHTKKEAVVDESDKMPSLQSEDSGV